MNSVKKIFALKKVDSKDGSTTKIHQDVEKIKLSYYQSGFGSSKQSQGNPNVFRECLAEIYEQFKRNVLEDKLRQQELNRPWEEEKSKELAELRKRETALDIAEGAIQRNLDKIEKLNNDIVEVKRNPEKFGIPVDKRPKAQFYLGLIVLLPITLYLMVFYISASYSAFFKDFQDTSLIPAIFDGNALTKAINEGTLEGIFVGTIPFAFMGLGYLIHMFLKFKHWSTYFKISLLLVVTFIFDAILAYLIEKKIYDFQRTPDSPEFDLEIAFQSVDFWGIIFAGFVVYIIWGLVLDFVMKEYDNLDKVKSFINTLRADIKNCRGLIGKEEERVKELKQDITDISAKIEHIQRTIDGTIFPKKEYLHYHTQYVKGWYIAIADDIAAESHREKIYQECNAVQEEFLRAKQISSEDSEVTIYKNMI